MKNKQSPVREYKYIVDSSNSKYINRVLIGTPTLGNIRMEWAGARYGMTIPTNWSMVQVTQFLNPYIPVRFSVADAQNLIVQHAIEKDFEWLLLIEDDTIPPPDAIIRFNKYMRDESHPVVSGLYFTKSTPAEPMIYRGRGSSYYTEWKKGDLVYADGVPTGMLLIHMGLIRKMWEDSPEYLTQGRAVRRVFENPMEMWFDEASNQFSQTTGTSDLNWCTRVIEGNYLTKSGWDKFAKMKYPFLIDTNIACMQIDRDGVQYPIGGIDLWCRQAGNI